MLRGVLRSCTATRCVIHRQCATFELAHRKELAPRTSEPGKPPKQVDRTPRSGATIHKLSSFPATYDVKHITRAMRACSEPLYDENPVQVKFYCLISDEKDKKDKFRTVGTSSVLPYPEFGEKATVGLFTDGPLKEEMKDAFHHIVLRDDFTKFFTSVHKGEEDLCDIYVCTSKVEMFLKKYGNILREKTPSVKKGLVADTVEDMTEVLKKACFLRRFDVNPEGQCSVDVGDLDFDPDHLSENIQHIGFRIKDLMKREEGDILEYAVLSHGRVAFCIDLESIGLNF